MKLTKKKAIEISIELWTWLAETGKRKYEWHGWEKYGEMQCDCPLCEYSLIKKEVHDCLGKCPYYEKFGFCFGGDSVWHKWNFAQAPRTRKKYAKLFLEQLKEL